MPLRLLNPRDDSHQFQPLLAEIEEDPGSPLGPLTFWLVVATFTFFVLWALLGEVDVVVSARWKVIPLGEVKLIQPLTGGVVGKFWSKKAILCAKDKPWWKLIPRLQPLS